MLKDVPGTAFSARDRGKQKREPCPHAAFFLPERQTINWTGKKHLEYVRHPQVLWDKNKAGEEEGEQVGYNQQRRLRAGLTAKVTFQQRPEGGERRHSTWLSGQRTF